MNPKYCCEVEPEEPTDITVVTRCKDCTNRGKKKICPKADFFNSDVDTSGFDNWYCAEGKKATDYTVDDDDVADIMNTINDALEDTKYEAVGYDNTDVFMHVLIEKKLEYEEE